MLYVKVVVVSLLLGLPVFALSSFIEFGVSGQELASVQFWLAHPLALFSYPIITALVLFLFQFQSQGLFGAGAGAGAGGGRPKSGKDQGQVKWFNSSKGYGFIAREEGDDVFVHYRSILGKGHRSLYEGQEVEFTVSMGEKGLQADEVLVISDVKKRGQRSDK